MTAIIIENIARVSNFSFNVFLKRERERERKSASTGNLSGAVIRRRSFPEIGIQIGFPDLTINKRCNCDRSSGAAGLHNPPLPPDLFTLRFFSLSLRATDG